MPRIVAWILRGVFIALACLIVGYTFISPWPSAERFGFRLFGFIAVVAAVMVWQLTAPARDDTQAEPRDSDVDA